MDPLSWGLALAAGAAVGVATGLLPGLHVNTLVGVVLVALPGAGPAAAVFLVAVGTVHTFVGILPATYLGAPGEDTALVSLPAHRLLHEGLAPSAIHLSAHASLLALTLAVLVALPYKWLLMEPGRGLLWLDEATLVLVLAAMASLLAQESRRGPRAVAAAAIVMGLAGLLGLVARDAPVAGFLPVPASPMLPLLAGLFGLPALLVALRDAPVLPPQLTMDRPLRRPSPRGCTASGLLGTLAAAWTAVLPGLTAAVATALTPRTHPDDARRAVAALSAVNTAHATFALIVLWITNRPRTGLAQALGGLLPVNAWERGHPPPELVVVLGTALAAGVLGYLATLALDRLAAPRVGRVPARALNGAALAVVLLLVLVLTGPFGLLVAAAGAAVGLLPLACQIRRVHLVGCLLVPVVLSRLG